jgi:MFS transporter, CP family, cyanate transporter
MLVLLKYLSWMALNVNVDRCVSLDPRVPRAAPLLLTENVAVGEQQTDNLPSFRSAALITLIGFQLRSVIVGVPPVLPELRADLHLSFLATGALTGIPVLGLGAAAVPGALLVNRFGARRVVSAAALGLGLAASMRLSPPLPYSLFIWTAILALLIGVAQPAIAVLIRNWFPGRIQQTSTIYAMSLGAGALAGSTISVYLLAIGGWRGTFVAWAVLALLAAGVWIWRAPGRGSIHEPLPHGLGRLVRNRQVWHVAALFGGQSLVFYGGTTWIPFLLQSTSHAYLALVLFLFQVISLPLTAILATIQRPWATSRIWYTTGGLLMSVGSLGLMLGLTGFAWLWAPIAGLGNTMVFAGANSLPALLAAERSEVAGYTALMLTAGYTFAFFGPLVGGLLLDSTKIITSPFWVVTAAALMTAVLGALLSIRPRVGRLTQESPGVARPADR